MKPLIFVKHSLPAIAEGIPARKWRLSDEGRERTRLLAGKLAEYRPDVIISSLEIKAQETASILAENLNLEFAAFEGLHEHDRSKSPFYSQKEFQNIVQNFFAQPDVLIFGDETADQALNRFQPAVDSVLHTHEDKTILIVSHGTVISLFVSHLTGSDGFGLWKELGLPSFVVLDLQSKTLLKTENLY